MSVNLLELAQGAIGKQVLGQLSGVLGESEEKTQSGIGAALPAILGVLMKKANTQDGAREIYRQVEEQDDSILDNLGDLLGGAGKSGLLSAGLAIAKMLFGNKFDQLGGVLGRKTGMGGGTITQLISFLIPIVMSILSRQQKNSGFDAMGLASMLGEQKQYLGNSLSGEVADTLGLGSLMSAVSGASDAVTGAARQTGAAAGRAADAVGAGARDAAEAGGSLIGKLLPLIAILAIALIGWMFLMRGTGNPAGGPTAEEVIEQEGPMEIPVEGAPLSPPTESEVTLELNPTELQTAPAEGSETQGGDFKLEETP